MFADYPTSNLGVGFILARSLGYAWLRESLGRREDSLTSFLGPMTFRDHFPESETSPDMVLWGGADAWLFEASGARTRGLVTSFAVGCSAAPQRRYLEYVNPAVGVVADSVFPTLATRLLTPPRILLFSGHSFGGAVCGTLAGLVRRVMRSLPLRLSCFGSPRYASDGWINLLTNVDSTRWATQGDPIVFCPPRSNEAPLLYAASPFDLTIHYAGYTQLGEGNVLFDSGQIAPLPQPPLTTPFQDLSVASFFSDNSSVAAQSHRITSYASRLGQAAITSGSLDFSGVPGSQISSRLRGEVTVDPLSQAELDNILAQSAAAAAAALMVFAFPLPYTARRSGGSFCVFYQDTLVAVCRTKGQARTLARALNSSISRINRATAVDRPELAGSVATELGVI